MMKKLCYNIVKIRGCFRINTFMIDKENKLKTGQKLAAGVLAVFGVFIIIIWAFSFKNAIYGPFQYDEITKAEICPGGNCEESAETDLFNKDTDKDGISDWDELNIYRTSPYMEDSDSDGYNDKEEIEAGFDPNCPQGINCSAFNSFLTEDREESLENNFLEQPDFELLNSLLIQEGIEGGLEMNGVQFEEEEQLQNVLAGASNADQLRKLLLEAGMDKEVLDQISDEILAESYQEVLDKSN